jgi:hypothetical protein
MDSFEKHERMRDARRRLRAQRRRAGELRGRVVAMSLIGFVLLWGVVFAQMATGNDPVLSDRSAAAPTPAGHRHPAREQEVPLGPADTYTEEADGSAQAAREAAEVAELELAELEAAELEAAEAELLELEPAPVTTSQS